jgi:hypothetical protein
VSSACLRVKSGTNCVNPVEDESKKGPQL